MILRTIALATALLVALALTSRAPTSAQVDVTGFWHMTIVITTFSTTTECDAAFDQTGADVNGYFGCDAGSGTFTGVLANSTDIDATLTLMLTGGTDIDAHAIGTIAADGESMSGTWHSDFFLGVDGTFQGNRLHFPKGDLNCDNNVDGRDAIVAFSYLAGLTPQQSTGCPHLTTGISHLFGDMDCDTHIAALDGLALVRYIGALPPGLPSGCAPIGA